LKLKFKFGDLSFGPRKLEMKLKNDF
jgi:hypothetical protein